MLKMVSSNKFLVSGLISVIVARFPHILREFKQRKFMTHYESCVGAPMILQLKYHILNMRPKISYFKYWTKLLFFHLLVKIPIEFFPEFLY